MQNKDEKYIEDLLFGYFAGELTQEREKELLDWLRDDPSHKETLSEMSDWWATAHVPVFVSDMRSDFEVFFNRLNKKEHPGSKSRMRSFIFIRNIAAAILALVTVGSISYYMGQRNEKENTAAILNNKNISSEVITPMGAMAQVLLPDGSHAWVNAGSTLRYYYNQGKGVREVDLTGEAYFNVKQNKEHPFRVKSDNLDIQVLGTSFNVKAYTNDEAVRVALVTGSVHVQVNQPEKEAIEFTLSRNRMLTFNKDSHNVEISEFKSTDITAWTTGSLRFENRPFTEIAKDLERKFGVQIDIESKRLKNEIFSGSFASGYSLDEILREFDVEKRYRRIQNGNKLIIRDK